MSMLPIHARTVFFLCHYSSDRHFRSSKRPTPHSRMSRKKPRSENCNVCTGSLLIQHIKHQARNTPPSLGINIATKLHIRFPIWLHSTPSRPQNQYPASSNVSTWDRWGPTYGEGDVSTYDAYCGTATDIAFDDSDSKSTLGCTQRTQLPCPCTPSTR